MSKESSQKQIKQTSNENSLLEEEIDILSSKFQDIITQIAYEKYSETHSLDKCSIKCSKADSKGIKSEITKHLRLFNERTKNKIDELQIKYEQDTKNQQIKYIQLEDQLRRQQAISQKEIKVRSDLIRREESLTKQNKGLIKDNEKLRNKKNDLKNEVTKKNLIIDSLTQKIDQISNEYNEFIEKIVKEKQQQKDQFRKHLSETKSELSQSKETQTSLTNKINEITKSINGLQTENSSLKEENKANKSDLKKLLEENTINEQRINQLKEENQKIMSAFQLSEAEKQNLKSEIDSLNEENKSNKSDLKKLLEEKAEDEKNINQLKEENQKINIALDSAEADKKKLIQDVDKLNNKLTEQIKLLSEQKSIINELQIKQDADIEKFKQMKNENEQKHQKELQEIRNLLDDKQNILTNQSQKLAEKEEIISNLMKEKEEKERDNKSLQMNYDDLNKKYTTLKEESNSEKEKLMAEILQLQESNKIMKQKIIDFEIAENDKNIVKEIFNRQVFSDNDIQQYPDEEVFIPQEFSQKSIQVIDYYDDILPTITFHFDKSPEEFGFDYFNQILNESSDGNAVIINVEKGSTMVKVALALFIKQEDIVQDKLSKIVNCVKEKLNSSIGKSVIGNLVDEPMVKIPDDKKIKELCSKPSLNLFQNTQELDEKINVEEIKKEVIKITNEKKAYTDNWKYIFSHQTFFDQMEKQVREDIYNNQFEMTIVGQTLIANKFIDVEYEEIKNKIPSEDITECFLYHGSRLKNHQKIIKKHFLMPGQDKMEHQLDAGYYGKGIYATENIFYASMYSNGFNLLKVNEKAYVLCCKAVYNKNKVKELYDLSYNGKEFDDEIKNNYGINHALVGNCNQFFPIKKSDIEKCYIYGQEFVFSNKFQLIPLCSFTIMRKDHCIIWKDEHIENNENSEYMKELSKKMEINVYFKKSIDDALEMIKKKKRSKIKLITNGGSNLSGKTLIEKARQIIGSNFACLVFASSSDHIKWVSKMENVLFTKSPADFRAFSELKMEKNDILNFAHRLEEMNNYKFKINESELLKFPSVNDSLMYFS